ncbi:MAG TPA: hypothetical protein VK487_09590 [Candidatus Bathyarchaeia archaeon]|nr:hypothetical protein [Candidatus Bathyarchaeia archaeon]
MEKKIIILFGVSLIALILSLFAVVLVLNSGINQMTNPNPKIPLSILSFYVAIWTSNHVNYNGDLDTISIILPSKYLNSCLFNCELVVRWLTTSGVWKSSSEEMGFLYPAIASFATPYEVTNFPWYGLVNFNVSTLRLPQVNYIAPVTYYGKWFQSVQNVSQCLNIDAYGYAKP